MTTGATLTVRRLCDSAARLEHESATDGQLLRRFLDRRDEAAFGALLRRHGPMVLGVCRRILRDHHDADDAFQVTFFVLVRKAAALAGRRNVGDWLYGVAYHTALKTRAASVKRREKERHARPAAGPNHEVERDLLALLDRELNRLPEKYRTPLVLCELEGRSRKEVAALLNIPEGTLSSRLAAAKKRLARRFAHLGVPTAALTAALADSATAAPPSLLDTTTEAAALLATAGHAGLIPPKLILLTEGVMKSMLLAKLKVAAGAALVVATVTLTAVGFTDRPAQADPPAVAQRPDDAKKPADPPAPAESPKPKGGPLGMKFVPLPKGTFYMGWNGTMGSAKKTEIKEDFEIAIYTVTQGLWQEVMGRNPSWFSRGGRGKDKVKDIKDEELKQFPVENVSWDDAQEFIKKLNEQEKGKGWLYRLPTEAEWEYACRGGATSEEECSFDYYFAKPTNDLSSKEANFNGDKPAGKADKGPNLQRPTKVGSYAPNKLGLYDMHGNVWQWCEDLYDPKASGDAASNRVLRGGACGMSARLCRAAYRFWFWPGLRRNDNGFRLARVPNPPAAVNRDEPKKPADPPAPPKVFDDVTRPKADDAPGPQPVDDVRGTVTAVDGIIAIVSLGKDHGVDKGTILDVYRMAPKPVYLGTLRLTVARERVAVGTFTAADKTATIRKGDSVSTELKNVKAPANVPSPERAVVTQKAIDAAKALPATDPQVIKRKTQLLDFIAREQAKGGDRDGAAKTFQLAVEAAKSLNELNKDESETWWLLMQISSAQADAGLLVAALRTVDEVKSANPKLASHVQRQKDTMRYFIVQTLAKAGHIAEAKDLLETIKITERDTTARDQSLQAVADGQIKQKDYAGAQETLGAIRDSGFRRQGYGELVTALARAGDRDAARKVVQILRKEMDRYRDDEPSLGEWAYYVAQAQGMIGDVKEAQEWIDKLKSPELKAEAQFALLNGVAFAPRVKRK